MTKQRYWYEVYVGSVLYSKHRTKKAAEKTAAFLRKPSPRGGRLKVRIKKVPLKTAKKRK